MALFLLVLTPNCNGVPGVELMVWFNTGEMTDGYIQA